MSRSIRPGPGWSPAALAEVERQAGRLRKGWSNAQPTEAHGIRFPSRMEARVYEYLLRYFEHGTSRHLYRQVRVPLLAVAPDEKGRPLYMTIDFLVQLVGGVLWVDAKGGRRSREWRRGKAAFEKEHGKLWEWDGKGEPPWEQEFRLPGKNGG